MIFDEIYGVYYNTVADIIAAAQEGGLDERKIKEIIASRAFAESDEWILAALTDDSRWQLLNGNLETPLVYPPTMGLTLLEKRWLKAVLSDPRIRLFDFKLELADDIEPLFCPDDIKLYDKYLDGDSFTDEGYIERFRLLLAAIKERHPVSISYVTGKNHRDTVCVLPEKLEYSEKDDKFRLIAGLKNSQIQIRLSSIAHCEYCTGLSERRIPENSVIKSVTFSLKDEADALERVLLHFSEFERKAVKINEDEYRITVNYYAADETELVIRILSFGHHIKVTEPESFVDLIKQRLISQKTYII